MKHSFEYAERDIPILQALSNTVEWNLRGAKSQILEQIASQRAGTATVETSQP